MSNKKTYRVRNWKEYNKALVQRGSLTLWIREDVLEKWRVGAKNGKRGGVLKFTRTRSFYALCM